MARNAKESGACNLVPLMCCEAAQRAEILERRGETVAAKTSGLVLGWPLFLRRRREKILLKVFVAIETEDDPRLQLQQCIQPLLSFHLISC